MCISANLSIPIMVLQHNRLTNIIGVDHELLIQCPSSIKASFTLVGVLIWLVILLTYTGSIAAILHVTNYIVIAVTVGLIVGWMLCNIYTFILIIFFATPLNNTEIQSKFSFSKIAGCIYVSFIALFASVPLELFLFKDLIQSDITMFKTAEISRFEIETKKYFVTQAQNLKKQIAEISLLNDKTSTNSAEYYAAELKKLDKEKTDLISEASAKIKASNYTHKKIEILFYKYPLSKIISLFIILLFLAPMLVIFYTKKLYQYHDLKRNNDKKLIDMEYLNFKSVYSQILLTNFNKEENWSEPYADPPYNQIKKTKAQPEYLSQKDLLTDIYYEEE